MPDDERQPLKQHEEPTVVTDAAQGLLAPLIALFAALIGGILGALMTAFARVFGIKVPGDDAPDKLDERDPTDKR